MHCPVCHTPFLVGIQSATPTTHSQSASIRCPWCKSLWEVTMVMVEPPDAAKLPLANLKVKPVRETYDANDNRVRLP